MVGSSLHIPTEPTLPLTQTAKFCSISDEVVTGLSGQVLNLSMDLRPYQVSTVESIAEKWANGINRLLVSSATGTGKTKIIAEVPKLHEKRTLILVHTTELMEQAVDKVGRWNKGLDIGVEMGGQYAGDHHQVVVASVQTLGRQGSDRIQKFDPNEFGAIVIDEAHHACAPGYLRILKHFGLYGPDRKAERTDILCLGVTATPFRSDGIGLGGVFDDIAFEYTLLDGIRDRFLVDIKCFRAQSDVSLDQVKTVAGDLQQDQLAIAVNNQARNNLIVKKWEEVASDRKTVAFTVDIQHAKALAYAFQDAGHNFEAVWGTDPERKDKINKLHSGELQGLCNAMLLTEGFDCLDSETEILTSRGWKGRGQIYADDAIVSFNKETEKMELTPMLGYAERAVKPGEKMLEIQSQHVNIRTTEGHQFHVKLGRNDVKQRKIQTLTGRELSQHHGCYSLPLSAELDLPGIALSNDEIRLVAWFMTDGGFENRTFAISQSKPETTAQIKALLDRLGLDYKLRVKKRKGYGSADSDLNVFCIPKGTHSGSLARRGWYPYEAFLNKDVAGCLKAMTREQFKVFWTELLKGDGSNNSTGNKSEWLWCASKKQADEYTAMAVMRGFAASCQPETTKYGTVVYRVSVRDAQWLCSDSRDERAAKMALTEPRQGEVVWCVKNKNSTLVTRRKGKIAIIGNCPDVACVILARPTKSKLVFIQQVGRGTRIAEGKEDCLLIDVVDNTSKHSIVSAASLAGLPSTVSIEGQKVSEVAAKVSKAGASQDIDFSKLKDINDLDAYLQEIELYKVPKEVEENSKLNWVKTSDNMYCLMLPGALNSLKIIKSGAEWDVTGIVNGSSFGDRFPTVPEAMKWADNMLKRFGDGMYANKKREGTEKWRTKEASAGMKKWLEYYFKVNRLPVPPGLNALTQGEASRLLDRFKGMEVKQ